MKDLHDPEKFVENAAPIYNFTDDDSQEERQLVETVCQANPSGDKVMLYARFKGKNEKRLIGWFNTFSKLD